MLIFDNKLPGINGVELTCQTRQFPLEEGNARELQLLIERTVMTAPWGTTITRSEVETLVLRQTKTANLADVWAAVR